MRKLSLNLEALTVESFETDGSGAVRGTVQGHYGTWKESAPLSCDYGCNTQQDGTCPSSAPSCDASCDGTCEGHTCDASCNGTCPGQFTCDHTCGCPTSPPECWD
jgi:hypothetical protein